MTERDQKGRLLPGHKGSNQYSKQQSDTQSEPSPDTDALPSLDTSFDDDLIAAAESYGKPRSKVGRRAWCEALRDTRPVEFAALLRPALARKAEAATSATGGGPGVHVSFTTVPSGMCVDADGKLVEAPDARAEWERKSGMNITTDEPPPPPSKPVLVQPRDDEDQPSPREDEDDGTDDGDRGTDMNDLLRSIPKPKWAKPRW